MFDFGHVVLGILSAGILLAVGCVIVTVIYQCVRDKLRERRNAKARAAELKRLRETLTPYDYARTVDDAVNKSFDFMHLHAGDRVRVRKSFTDYNGSLFEAGDTWYFACAYYLPYDGGYTLYISHDRVTIGGIYLQVEEQSDVCGHAEKYFEVVEVGAALER